MNSAKAHVEKRTQFEGIALTELESRPLYWFLKRIFDIVFSAAVLICFSWLFLFIALLIKIDDPKAPVFLNKSVSASWIPMGH